VAGLGDQSVTVSKKGPNGGAPKGVMAVKSAGGDLRAMDSSSLGEPWPPARSERRTDRPRGRTITGKSVGHEKTLHRRKVQETNEDADRLQETACVYILEEEEDTTGRSEKLEENITEIPTREKGGRRGVNTWRRDSVLGEMRLEKIFSAEHSTCRAGTGRSGILSKATREPSMGLMSGSYGEQTILDFRGSQFVPDHSSNTHRGSQRVSADSKISRCPVHD